MKIIARYTSLVKFAHTVFALPFALVGFVYGVETDIRLHIVWWWWLPILAEVLLCMVFARNAAMGFNRWADRRFDAENPRTAERDIPAGRISPRAALWFVIANVAGFIAVAGLINRLTLILSPVALAVILGYSYTKRFTAWSHMVLGLALAIAPVGAYIAVAGALDMVPILLAGVVMTWVAGFDILYSLQDAAHDRAHGLHSIPARFSPAAAVGLSVVLHVVSLAGVAAAGLSIGGGWLYWVGAGLFAVMVTAQHLIFGPSRTERIARLFTFLNGASSIVYAVFTITDLLLR
jgi:4-hydroxybenzoate polyprenyltransferase